MAAPLSPHNSAINYETETPLLRRREPRTEIHRDASEGGKPCSWKKVILIGLILGVISFSVIVGLGIKIGATVTGKSLDEYAKQSYNAITNLQTATDWTYTSLFGISGLASILIWIFIVKACCKCGKGVRPVPDLHEREDDVEDGNYNEYGVAVRQSITRGDVPKRQATVTHGSATQTFRAGIEEVDPQLDQREPDRKGLLDAFTRLNTSLNSLTKAALTNPRSPQRQNLVDACVAAIIAEVSTLKVCLDRINRTCASFNLDDRIAQSISSEINAKLSLAASSVSRSAGAAVTSSVATTVSALATASAAMPSKPATSYLLGAKPAIAVPVMPAQPFASKLTDIAAKLASKAVAKPAAQSEAKATHTPSTTR